MFNVIKVYALIWIVSIVTNNFHLLYIVQYTSNHCRAVQISAVQCSAVQCSAEHSLRFLKEFPRMGKNVNSDTRLNAKFLSEGFL